MMLHVFQSGLRAGRLGSGAGVRNLIGCLSFLEFSFKKFEHQIDEILFFRNDPRQLWRIDNQRLA